jgi:hypothetical protein
MSPKAAVDDRPGSRALQPESRGGLPSQHQIGKPEASRSLLAGLGAEGRPALRQQPRFDGQPNKRVGHARQQRSRNEEDQDQHNRDTPKSNSCRCMPEVDDGRFVGVRLDRRIFLSIGAMADHIQNSTRLAHSRMGQGSSACAFAANSKGRKVAVHRTLKYAMSSAPGICRLQLRHRVCARDAVP